MKHELFEGDVVLAGVPLDAHSSFMQGPAFAPARIREALHNGSANLSAEDGTDLGGVSRWKDSLDLPVFGMHGQAAMDAIEKGISERLVSGARLLSLGGDHAVSYPIVKAHTAHHGRLNILHIDAHPDLYDNQDGDRFGHGCPFARIMELGVVDRLVQVGIRTLNPHQREQAERFGVEIIDMRSWSDSVQIAFDGAVYLSLDLDALDPAFAPGVSHFEPGGLTTREVISLINRFKGQLIGADIVELNPHRDPFGMTAMVAAKFVKELSARLLRD